MIPLFLVYAWQIKIDRYISFVPYHDAVHTQDALLTALRKTVETPSRYPNSRIWTYNILTPDQALYQIELYSVVALLGIEP